MTNSPKPSRDLPLILVSNDDGYRASGLRVLVAELKRFARVVVCAPANEQSAARHGITLHRPLRLLEQEPGVFSVNGTPADCIYVALNSGNRVLSGRPNLVLSGLNHGLNLGNDIFYSGTVAAAREAALSGFCALALSADSRTDPAAAARVSAQLARSLLSEGPEGGSLFNVNFPPGDSWDLCATVVGVRLYEEAVDFRRDPRGKEYLWIGGSHVSHKEMQDSDTQAYDAGVIGITPVSLELWSSRHQHVASDLAARVGALPVDAS